MEKRRIALLTYRDKFEKYDNQLRNEFPDTEVIQHGGDFSYEKLSRVAKRVEEEGYEAIIARWLTVERFMDDVTIPIILAEPDMLDVLDGIITSNIGPGEKVAFLFHKSNSLLKYRELKDYLKIMFGLDAEIYYYTGWADFNDVVDSIIATGRLLFCGVSAWERIEQVGGRYAPISTGENAIRNAVIEAINVIDIRRRDADQTQTVETILNNNDEGMLCVNQNYSVRWINNYARRALGIPFNQPKERINIKEYLPIVEGPAIFVNEKSSEIISLPDGTTMVCDTRVHINAEGVREVFFFIQKPDKIFEEEQRVRHELYKKGRFARFNLDDIMGESEAITELKEATKKCADFDINVLLFGESGVGKELFAQCIHNESPRKKEAFYAINCAALPRDLLESELFGYTEGAFTGAKKGGKPGIFEMAHKGTVFLDEIGELPLESQSALLRVLQESEVSRIGGDEIIPVDVRIIAATNKDLFREVEAKRFREDLFHRLNAVFLTIPPLRERPKDIPFLLNYFIEQDEKRYNLKYTGSLTDGAKNFLMHYDWKGNVREVQNFVRRIFALGHYEENMNEESVKALLLSPHLLNREKAEDKPPREDSFGGPTREDSFDRPAREDSFDKPTREDSFAGSDMEKFLERFKTDPFFDGFNSSDKKGKRRGRVKPKDIEAALAYTDGNRTEAAELLGISRSQLWRIMKKHQEK